MTYISGRVLKESGTRPALHVLKREQYEYDKFKHTSEEPPEGEMDFTNRWTDIIRVVEGRGCCGSWNIKTGVIQVVEDRYHAPLFFQANKKSPATKGFNEGQVFRPA